MAWVRLSADLVFGVLNRDPVRPLARLALGGDGLARVPLPVRRKFWIVSDPLLLNQVLVTEAARYDKGGPLYGVIADALGSEGLFTVNDPDVWRQLRRRMNPAFQRSSMGGAATVAADVLHRRMGEWDISQPVELFTEFKRANTELLVRYLFGEDIDSAEAAEFARLARPVFEGMAGQVFLPRWAPGGRAYRRAIAALDERVYAIIARRRASRHDEDDMLGWLLKGPGDGLRFTDEQVRDQVFTLFMAGFDSTATALAWACIYLAEDPETFRALRSEVTAVAGDGSPGLDDVGRLPLLGAFFQAVLHAHPSFPLYFRNARETSWLRGHKIAAGDQLIIAPHATHHDPAYWPDGFEPMRFTRGLSARERSAHLPFGKGGRKCIGEDMALVSGIITLAMMLQRFAGWRRTAHNSGQSITYAMTAPPKDRARMTLIPRESA